MKPLTRTELLTVLNLRNQGADVVEIELLTGLELHRIQNAFNNADKLIPSKRIAIK